MIREENIRRVVSFLNIALSVTLLSSNVNGLVIVGICMIVLEFVIIVRNLSKSLCLCCMKSIDIVSSLLLCERIFFFYFETCCDGFNTCFEVNYCVENVVCKLCVNKVFNSHGSDVHRC